MEQGYIGDGRTKEDLLEEYKEDLMDMGNTPQEVEHISGDNPFFIDWAYKKYLDLRAEHIHIISVGGAPSMPTMPILDIPLDIGVEYAPTYEVPTSGYTYISELEMNNEASYYGVDIEDNEAFDKYCDDNGYMKVFIEELDTNIYVYRG